MLLGGDEIARTQGGNNNGWCQDNEISWFDWEIDERGERQLEFTKRLIALRRAHPVFHRRDFLTGEDRAGSGLPDAWWFRPDGRRMTQHDWSSGAHVLGLFLNGEGITAPGPGGRARRGRLVPAAVQRLAGRGPRFTAAEPALRRASGRSCSTRPSPTTEAGSRTAAARRSR